MARGCESTSALWWTRSVSAGPAGSPPMLSEPRFTKGFQPWLNRAGSTSKVDVHAGFASRARITLPFAASRTHRPSCSCDQT
eukprot:scaffold44985_cov68-Phaeocystis_antarctica.AAC.7